MSSRYPVISFSRHNTDAYANAMTYMKVALGVFGNLKVGKGARNYIQKGTALLSIKSIIGFQDE